MAENGQENQLQEAPAPGAGSPPAAREGERPPEEEPSFSKTPPREFDIDIYRAWCKKCGICAAFCPRECLAPDEEGAPRVVHPERCTGCGWCELHCPDFAISVRERPRVKSPEEAD